MLRYFCFLTVILGVRSASAPFIKPCKLSDNDCVLASAKAAIPVVAPGIPELGIKPLDPMHMDLVKSEQGGLHLIFKNTDVTGMKGCTVDAFKADLSKNKQSITIRCTVTLKGDYTLSGQLLLLPVQGEGPYTIRIRDIIIKASSEVKTVQGPDGKPHWQLNNWRHVYQIKTSTNFKFENLFNGNKVLSDPIHDFMNNNWRDVMQEVAGPIVHSIVENVVDAIKALYNAVPNDELYIP